MRFKERIPIFLKLVDLPSLLITMEIAKYDGEAEKLAYRIREDLGIIQEFWEINPELRFTQVLINMGYIPNKPGFWYFFEEDTILENQGNNLEDYLLWKVRYDKNKKLLSRPKVKLVKDLDSDHIKAILDGHLERWLVPSNHIKVLREILIKRGAL